MLPIRWILPIVGALFALALAPLAFNKQEKPDSIAFIERPEPRETIVPMGIQRTDDGLKSSRNLDGADDLTGSVMATTPVAAASVVKSPAKRVRAAHRRSRAIVHPRAKQAMATDIFGGQRSRRMPKSNYKFNAVY